MSSKNILMASSNTLPLQFVGGAAASSATSTATPSFSLTSLSGGVSSSPQVGDVVIACIAFNNGSNRNITCTTAGYTRIIIQSSDPDDGNIGNISQMAIFYKYLSTAETTVAFNIGTAIASRFCVHVWRNADPYRPVCIARSSFSGQFSGSGIPNAPSITPPQSGNVVIAIGANTGSTFNNLANLTVPSGMTNFFQVTASTDSGIGIASILRSTAGAYDPPAFGGGNADTSLQSTQASLCIWPNQNVRPPEFIAATTTSPVATSTITINKPAGTQQGDLMLAFVSGSINLTYTGDTGWTEIADQGVEPSLRVAYKVAGASEPSSYVFTSSSTSGNKTGAILTYRYAAYDTSSLEAADPTFTQLSFSQQPTTTAQPWTTSIFFVGRDSSSDSIFQAFDVTNLSPSILTQRAVVNTATTPTIYIGDTPSRLPTDTITTATNTNATIAYTSAGNLAWAAVDISLKRA
jgi:hypothetical protein